MRVSLRLMHAAWPTCLETFTAAEHTCMEISIHMFAIQISMSPQHWPWRLQCAVFDTVHKVGTCAAFGMCGTPQFGTLTDRSRSATQTLLGCTIRDIADQQPALPLQALLLVGRRHRSACIASAVLASAQAAPCNFALELQGLAGVGSPPYTRGQRIQPAGAHPTGAKYKASLACALPTPCWWHQPQCQGLKPGRTVRRSHGLVGRRVPAAGFIR